MMPVRQVRRGLTREEIGARMLPMWRSVFACICVVFCAVKRVWVDLTQQRCGDANKPFSLQRVS